MLKSVAGNLTTGAQSGESAVRKGSGGQKKAEELKKACQDFEAILSSQLLKAMRQSSLKAEESDQAREIFEGMMDETLSRELSRHNRFGLGNMLYEKLLPLVTSEGGGQAAIKDDG